MEVFNNRFSFLDIRFLMEDKLIGDGVYSFNWDCIYFGNP